MIRHQAATIDCYLSSVLQALLNAKKFEFLLLNEQGVQMHK